MSTIDPIRVEGLGELRRALAGMESGANRELRVVLNQAADLVVDGAQRRVPVKSGKARKSIKKRSTQTQARVVAGGTKAPYFGWLDYGGKVYRHGKDHKPNQRRFYAGGRIIYPAFDAERARVNEVLSEGLARLVRENGLEVDTNG